MQIIVLIVSVLLSVISGIISSICGFDVFQSIVTGILTFLCIEMINVTVFLGGVYFRQKKEKKFHDRINLYSIKIQEINDFYYEVERDSQGDKDLFSVTCSKAIDNLYLLLKDASEYKKIEISSDYIINVAGVFEALNITRDKKVRLTFPIKEVSKNVISTAEDRKFFETIYNKIKNGEVSDLLILMILDNENLLNDPQIDLLLKFYYVNAHYDCKYILAQDFIEACEHNRVSTASLDFGIYGPNMLFIEESLFPYKGVYYKDSAIVERYTKLFDEVWNFEAITHNNPKNSIQPNTISKSDFLPKQFFHELTNIQSIESFEPAKSTTTTSDENIAPVFLQKDKEEC
ncbi:hypothetical protein OCV67_10850 [Porcipelethomonas ammoniilytica]|uniref:hypothetical protein n=1 Tax=Porcipelethomonas ammoniilytica TaxID=2981722 RepID=UPI000820F2D3|nr:hypothetical protein [Porcipelethomonas ammoniilytica]MCU6720423.1 hypothetical protein [Porcipelethomonas ammoniilytica]SCJ12459.1 Uncharacterised protein [uncultured Ruminococcus sp.]